MDLLLGATYSLTASTWFWIFVPMPLLIVLSIITYFTERE